MDLKTFIDEIKLLDEQHKIHINSGAKPSEFSEEYKNAITNLIYKSVSCDEWLEIIKHISFLIYSGGFMEIGLEQTINVAEIALRGKDDAEERAIVASREGFVAREKVKELGKALKEAPKSAAKHAVSMREDQLLKPSWEHHVKRCVESGATIRNINDLLNIPGYDANLAGMTKTTLKNWAKEAVPSLSFKAGRTT